MLDYALLKFDRYSKYLENKKAYIRKRIFMTFQPDRFKQMVGNMPELTKIIECTDINIAANLLTKGLIRILDSMAPIKTIQLGQIMHHTWVRKLRYYKGEGTQPKKKQ